MGRDCAAASPSVEACCEAAAPRSSGAGAPTGDTPPPPKRVASLLPRNGMRLPLMPGRTGALAPLLPRNCPAPSLKAAPSCASVSAGGGGGVGLLPACTAVPPKPLPGGRGVDPLPRSGVRMAPSVGEAAADPPLLPRTIALGEAPGEGASSLAPGSGEARKSADGERRCTEAGAVEPGGAGEEAGGAEGEDKARESGASGASWVALRGVLLASVRGEVALRGGLHRNPATESSTPMLADASSMLLASILL